MERTAAARELNTRFAVAREADDAAIRRLLRENPMRGAISVSFEREPDYFRGVNIAGGEDETIVAFHGGRLVGMGRCTRRECWVDGRATRVGYLAELRLDGKARGRAGIVRDGYRFFHEQQNANPAEIYFTSIADDNERARRLLESGVRGLPRYEFLAEQDTLLIAVPRHHRAAKLNVETLTAERLLDTVRLLNAQRHQFAAVWTVERLRALEDHGLPLDRFLLALDGDEIIACGALWDQRTFRQMVVRGYSRALAVMRPALNFASRFLRTPRLPALRSILPHAFVSPLAFVPGAEVTLPDFVEALFPLATAGGIDFLTLAMPAADARLPVLRRRFSTRTWRSRLYRVAWPDDPARDLHGPFLPDVALL